MRKNGRTARQEAAIRLLARLQTINAMGWDVDPEEYAQATPAQQKRLCAWEDAVLKEARGILAPILERLERLQPKQKGT